ncbi:hypothetical protein BJF80_08885 [Serinicoccus sp. CUA-874]|uniref:recombinase family protein n=1 Tax=Serinicoccus sp. CUA-874 TaxID=1517939 RepID=UPI0009645136|nr:recombinase family protein [Serinicoccus sp. CUA-874]OLT15537.1 hypothetical protein BJF80_08885 [Serinicoccus sp. CUA-874]
MSGQVVAYLRVSSVEQNLDRQRETVGQCDRTFEEKVSGGAREGREALAECIAYLRDGDTLRVASMDRLARSLTDLRAIVDEITTKGAAVTFVKEGQTYSRESTDSMSRFLLNMLGAFAEFERELIRERQAEGIKAAKERGVYRGRRRRLSPEQIEQARERVEAGVPVARVAREAGCSRTVLYDALGARGAYAGVAT